MTLRSSADGDDAELVVEDTGCGIPPARIPELLKPFATGDPIAGTGLGLAIVAEIVAAHDGAFSLEPRPGGGTVARIVLPACVTHRTVFA